MVTTRYFDQRERLTEHPEVFTYDELPQEFRVKMAYLLGDLYEFLEGKMDSGSERLPRTLWQREIVRALGVDRVPGDDIHGYFLSADVSQFFIGVEVLMNMALLCIRYSSYGNNKKKCRDSIHHAEETINTLLRYFALGYEISLVSIDPHYQVMRKDTEYTHAEVVKPALRLLIDEEFEHADRQFRDAHREFQEGNYADAITDASSALETVLKVVLDIDEGTAKELLKAAGDAGYFPSYLESSIGQWVNLLLELPQERNRFGDAHGKGTHQPDDRELERHARLALNLAASHILFIIDEYKRRQA